MERYTGQITVEQARKRFDEYYDNSDKSDIGRQRGKMLDMIYKKKPAFSYKCNITEENIHLKNGDILEPGLCEPGSEKYLLEEGPKTYDLEGIDSFDEGERVKVPNTHKHIISKGSVNYRPASDTQDKIIDSLENLEDGRQTSRHIYGPRLQNIEGQNNKLYNVYFGEKYQENIDRKHYGDKEDGTARHIIDLYWDKEGEIKRKNKKGWQLHNKQKNIENNDILGKLAEGVFVIRSIYEDILIYLDHINNTFVYEWNEVNEDYDIDLYKNNGEGEGNIDDFLEERGLTRLNIEEAEL